MPKTRKSKNSKKNKKDYVYALGRRREASSRVRLFRGNGQTLVNGKLIEEYFPGPILKEIWSKPLRVVDADSGFYATIKVGGGGKMGQAEAVALGIARALLKIKKEEYKIPLRKAGLLTRDSRIRERRKVGMGGKARREKQSPKR